MVCKSNQAKKQDWTTFYFKQDIFVNDVSNFMPNKI